ncbi:hypothetical protein NW762_012340 [Fusarium torreyae]|uniref:Lpxtg-domain-containing protein n=1 Tax=Fusarium torreyae TaxID=1237075 RepID=A0A9W8RQV7_9HYPO|nr:hypothetical protein NW762_012340 [Fusarium torreyae]
MQLPTLISAWGLLSPVAAILVADKSPCGTLCGNVLDATTTDDIVCKEDDYKSGAGIVYQQCVACELSSDYHTKDNETDQQWLLYNTRYAVSYCLFGVPTNDKIINTPCLTSKACGPFRQAVEYKNLSSNVDSYEYCDDWPVDDTLDFDGCTECLRAGDNYFLANFFTLLQAGCKQKPQPGVEVSIDGNVFSQDVVNVTEPSPVASLDPDWLDHGPISLGAKVGIAAGGVALILVILGFCIIWRGKRRRRAFLRQLENRPRAKGGWPTPLHISNDMRETPLSQKPFRSWDESPVSARSETTFPRYVSPYGSQFGSPVSATELQLAQWPVMHPNQQAYPPMPNQPSNPHLYPEMFPSMYKPDPSPSGSQIGVALGGDDSSLNTPQSKGKDRDESYEMYPVDGTIHGAIGIYQPEQLERNYAQQDYFDHGNVHHAQAYQGQGHEYSDIYEDDVRGRRR